MFDNMCWLVFKINCILFADIIRNSKIKLREIMYLIKYFR